MSEGTSFDPEATEPQPKKKSSALKWVLIILGGLCGLCCCGIIGGVGYLGMQAGVSIDPATGRTRTQEITEIEMPAGFNPSFSMSVPGQMKMIFWMGPGGMIVLMEGQGNVSKEDLRQRIDSEMKKQGNQGNIVIENRETKTYTIRGQETSFEIAKGKAEGKDVWQVTGAFPSKSGGQAVIVMILPADQYDEAAIDKLINSIK
jgi:hypothetical protein